MGGYEFIIDWISVAQQNYNIPLVQNFLDAEKQILDLINENIALKEENRKLSEKLEEKSTIERHDEIYLTLNSYNKKIKYCEIC